MIDLIVWSKDRACQLDLFLRSLATNLSGLFKVTVIYKCSNERFREGYHRLTKKLFCNNDDIFLPIGFFPEDDFEQDTRLIISRVNELVSFSTDDMVVYRKPSLQHLEVMKGLLPKHESEVFSFRLGLNTLMQDCHKAVYQSPLNNPINTHGVINWDCQRYHPHSNYGYPMALDMHVFKVSLIKRLTSEFHFNSTNQLESELVKRRLAVRYMSSFEESVAVNIPANNISGVTAVNECEYSTELLNELYLQGKRIDLQAIEKENIIGCHQEVSLTLR